MIGVLPDALGARVTRHGFTFVREMLSGSEVMALVAALEIETLATIRAGRRNLTQTVPAVRDLASSAMLHAIGTAVLGGPSFVVRVLLFDKTAVSNWGLGWHQDKAIAVRERRDVPGFSGWSVKEGVPHVHAPASVFERMVTVRVHLDDCDAGNGALRILPESHRRGRLTEHAIQQICAATSEITCAARAGDALVMSPLLLHGSSPALTPRHRRVLHFELAADELPDGLEWFERHSPSGSALANSLVVG